VPIFGRRGRDGGIVMTTETLGSLSYHATRQLSLEAGEISFVISRFLPKAETSEEFAYLCVACLSACTTDWCFAAGPPHAP